MTDAQQELDVKGLLCPLPVLKARKRLQTMAPGEVLKIDATDPAAVLDVPHFCAESGHELIDTREHDGVHSFWIRRA